MWISGYHSPSFPSFVMYFVEGLWFGFGLGLVVTAGMVPDSGRYDEVCFLSGL